MSQERHVISREVLAQRRLAHSEGKPPITETITARTRRQKARNIITGNWMPDILDPKRLRLISSGPIDHSVIELAQDMISQGFHFEIVLPSASANEYNKQGIDSQHLIRHGSNGYNYFPSGTIFYAPAELIEAARSRLKEEVAHNL